MKILSIPLIVSLLICIVFAGVADARTVDGRMRMYLYQSGTGSTTGGINDIHASVGDIITIDVYIVNPYREHITAMETYLTVPDRYFEIVKQGYNPKDGSWRPFIPGTFMANAGGTIVFDPVGNYTHGDSLTAMDNNIKDWQMDYVETTGVDIGSGRPYSSRANGVLCKFQLKCKMAVTNAKISIDIVSFYARKTQYYVVDSSDEHRFESINPCTISVSGFQLEPPLPDVIMSPGEINNSIDLDDYVNVTAIPDSQFTWVWALNNNIGVSIESDTHVLTLNAPSDYRGYEDIEFTSIMPGGSAASDTMRVTVDSRPGFTAALPDTFYVHEDSLEFVADLRNLITDADDPLEDLTVFLTTGNNITASRSADSLFIKGELNYSGMDSLRISLYDVYALGDSAKVHVKVLPVNDPPVLTGIPDITIERGKTHELNLSTYALDVDADPLTPSWGEPENLVITNDNMRVTITGVPAFIGQETVVMTVTDTQGLADSDTLNVTITPATDPPVWSKLPKIGFAQNRADSSLVLWDYVADPDDPDSLLTFEITNTDDIDKWEVNYSNGKLYLYDLDNIIGWDRLTVTATDPDGNMGSTQLLAFIAPADGTPIVGGIPDTTMVADTQADWVDLDDFYYDIDNTDSQMEWSWERLADADSSVTLSVNQFTHRVILEGLGADRYGINKVVFTVTDPGGKFADDIAIITVLEELNKPTMNLPPKIGFIAGLSDSLDLDNYVGDPMYAKSELAWTWNGNYETIITRGDSSAYMTRPVIFSGPVSWTGWERVDFTVINPMSGAARDTLTVFSVPADGTPVAGGLTSVSLKAGSCVSVALDNYFYDADTPEYAVTWTVSGNDSISVTIDPLSHIARICANSTTWEGSEVLTFTVTDPQNKSASMDTRVVVTGAVINNAFNTTLIRNPMQEDYMDIYVESAVGMSTVPTAQFQTQSDSTAVLLKTVSSGFFHGSYLLSLAASLGEKGTGTTIISGTALDGKALQDTTYFAYGYLDTTGGRIVMKDVALDVPEGALESPTFVTIIGDEECVSCRAKNAVHEVDQVGASYRIDPVRALFTTPAFLEFAMGESVDHAGIYRSEDGQWCYEGGTVSNGAMIAEISRGGEYAICVDDIQPRITGGTDDVLCALSDDGSGIDDESIQVRVNGVGVPFDYDPESGALRLRGAITVDGTDVSIMVSDRAGNTAERAVTLSGTRPLELTVEQNLPNPFNPTTVIPFSLSAEADVHVEVFDLLGRKIRVLTNERYPAGSHGLRWDARDDEGRAVSSGVYIYRVSAGSFRITRKMLLLR